MTTLTIVEHVPSATGSRLVVRVPDTAAAVFGGIAGDAIDETTTEVVQVDDGEGGTVPVEQVVPTGDTLVIVERDGDPDTHRDETRALIEHALSVAAVPAPDPEPITPPGTEL